MKAKQKAEQIVEHFDEILTYLESKNKVKLCALFLVNQLKDVAPYEDNNKAGWILDKQTIRYWEEVEQEIINL